VAALAVHDAAATYNQDDSILIKWPNDLLLNGAKFGGILAETLPENAVAIGMGINLAHAPQDTPYPATALGRVTPEKFLETLISAFCVRKRQWDDGEGFQSIRKDWTARAYGIGQPIRIGDVSGIYSGLGEDGALQVAGDDGQIANVHAGDVRFQGLHAVGGSSR
jgi:BirA family biotin operon repressor/biotin-[acetyl-CoA-carboxylase] ligase